MMLSDCYCQSVLACFLVAGLAVTANAQNSSPAEGTIRVGGMTLRYETPRQMRAYEKVSIKYKLDGLGDACVEAVATDNPAYEKYFDTAIPHQVAARFDYLSEDAENAKFRVTNTGDTIWKVCGYGEVSLHGAEAARFLPHEIAPKESFEREIPVRLLAPADGKGDARVVGLDIGYGDSRGSLEPDLTITTAFAKNEVGKSLEASCNFRTYPRHPALDEFGGAFVWKNNREKDSGTLTVEVPPWADRLVISLIREGDRSVAVIPIKPSPDGLRIARIPDKQWTLNGKPIVLMGADDKEDLPGARAKYGGDNIVVTGGIPNYPQRGPDLDYLKEVAKHGLKVFPVSLCYVRLQWIGAATGIDLMPGRIDNTNERVDALDPNFPKAYADYVDRVLKTAGEYLYRTSDGKIPIGLCDEAQYGYPWGFGYPTRWGGQTPADVAAFRVWLKEKYGSIDKLNARWKTAYAGFEGIDPSPICEIYPRDYPDPWKEWGPAIEDFDRFRSKIHNDMWRKTFAEIKKRHPEVLLGLNFYTDFASDTECIYEGFWKWGTGINWSARRTAVLPEDLDYLDFVTCWNTGSPEAARANINYWKKKGVHVIVFGRHYGKAELNERDEFYLPQIDTGGLGGLIIYNHNTAIYPTMRAIVEEGGTPALFADWTLGATIGLQDTRETVLLNTELARLAAEVASGRK